MKENENNNLMKIVKKKPRGGNSPVIGDNGVNTKPGDNSKIAGMLLEIHKWGEVDRSNPEALEERFWQYVEFCMNNDIRITNQAAYFAMGLTRDTVHDWESGETRTLAHRNLIKKVKSFCASYREQLGADGKLNPVTLVWWQKNYDGFVDKSEVVLTPNNPLGDTKDPAEIQQRLLEGIADED